MRPLREAPVGSLSAAAVGLDSVSKVYGSGARAVTALDRVTIAFAAREFTAVMGPSGSGKTTLLQVAAGIDRPTSGQVRIGDTELGQMSERRLTVLRRRRVGFVFQSFNLMGSLTAEQNVALPLRLDGRRPKAAAAREALARVGLDGRAGHRPGELSGGQQQRVAIARALVTGPEVIFAAGLAVAEVAAVTAAWRAARVRPAEALADASAGPPGLGPARWVLGLAAVGGGVALIITVPLGGALAGPAALCLAIGAALLSPVVLGLLAAALSWPLRAGPGAPGLLASTAVATHRRRAGAVAAPIVLIVALAGTRAIADTTTQATIQHVTAQRVRAPYVLVAGAGQGLPAATVRLAGQLPGVRAAVGLLPTTVFLLDPGLDNFGSPWDAAGLDPPAVPGPLDLGLQAGSLAWLTGSTVAVSSTLAGHAHIRVGTILNARLADLTPARLRVGAIYQRALGLGDIVLPMPLAEAHAAVVLDSAIFVSGPPATGAALAQLARSMPGAAVLTREQYLQAARAAAQASTWPIWLLIGLLAAFAALALLNTALMATAARQPELALIRLIGATRRQARRMIAWEALVTTLAGLAAGALIARVAVQPPRGQPGWHIAVPAVLSGGILVGVAVLGLAGAIVPARLALRTRQVPGT